jgi:hypothetical protein
LPANRGAAVYQSIRAIVLRVVGARLAGELDTAVHLSYRVIDLRVVGARLAGEPGRCGVSVKPRHRSSRASLAPTGEPDAVVYLSNRVIVLRGQVGSPPVFFSPTNLV